MKNNYLNFKKALIIMICLGAFTTQAQTTIPLTLAAGSYGAGTGVGTFTTGEISREGATFKLQVKITAADSETIYVDGTQWGVGDVSSGDTRTTIDYLQLNTTTSAVANDAATVSDIKVIDFAANGTSYTESSVSDLKFVSITIEGGNAAADRTTISVNDGTVTEIGRLAATSVAIPFQGTFVNNAGTSFTLSTGPVTKFYVTNGVNSSTSNRIAVGSTITLGYTFATDALGVNGFSRASNNDLSISPNPVVNTISLNMPIQSAEIIDLTGKTIKVFTTETNSYNVSDLASGTYILKGVSSEGSAFVKRFIKK